MGGMEFEYDEQGTTFYYFVLAVLVIILFPWTIWLWLRKGSGGSAAAAYHFRNCCCEPCLTKRELLKQVSVSTTLGGVVKKIVFVLLWLLFFAVLYKVSTTEIEYKEFDPYNELEIDRGASIAEIKKAYRRLSVLHHPDKGGDEKIFIRIAKAHEALTDDESRENWEKYGHPDGPGAMHFGIALPKWLVEKKNKLWVLAAYAFAFMIILPTAVGVWWYRSIRFSADHVLLDTEQLFSWLFRRTPNGSLKTILFMLSASREFGRQWNSEIVERESDNVEVPALIRKLSNFDQKREMPYILKARALIYAHLSRIPLPQNSLEIDKRYILKKCPLLVAELVATASKFSMARYYTEIPVNQLPRLETIEHCMRLHAMIIQGCWDNRSQLLQLPHITEDIARSICNRQRGKSARTLRELAELGEADRRQVLRILSDDQYRDVCEVLKSIPLLEVEAKPKVLDVDDEDEQTITAGSFVTIFVKLVRKSLSDVMTGSGTAAIKSSAQSEPLPDPDDDESESGDAEGSAGKDATKQQQKKPMKPWQQQQKKKGKSGGGPRKPQQQKKPALSSRPAAAAATANGAVIPTAAESDKENDNKSSDDESGSERETPAETEHTSNEVTASSGKPAESNNDDDEAEEERRWRRFADAAKREGAAAVANMDAKAAPIVHCPYLQVADKHEAWWVYLYDRKTNALVCFPVFVTSLQAATAQNLDAATMELPLKIQAPGQPGVYNYAVTVRSDSYLGVDVVLPLRLEVAAAPVETAAEIARRKKLAAADDEEDEDKSGSDRSSDEGEDHDNAGPRQRRRHASEDEESESSDSE